MPMILQPRYGVFAITLTRKGITFYIKDHYRTDQVQRIITRASLGKIRKFLRAWVLTVLERQRNGMVFTATGPISSLQVKKPLKWSMINGHSSVLVHFFLHLRVDTSNSFMEKRLSCSKIQQLLKVTLICSVILKRKLVF